MTPSTAHRMVRDAVKRGSLVRPSACSRCGRVPPPASDGRSQIHAHHAEYSRPLDVEWICARCHRAETPLPAKPGAPAFGERNGQAKLTAASVISAKGLRQQGLSYQAIANRFGVDKRTAMRAIKGEQWSQVAAAPPASEAKGA